MLPASIDVPAAASGPDPPVALAPPAPPPPAPGEMAGSAVGLHDDAQSATRVQAAKRPMRQSFTRSLRLYTVRWLAPGESPHRVLSVTTMMTFLGKFAPFYAALTLTRPLSLG